MNSFRSVLIVLGNAPKKDGRPSPQMVVRVRKAISLHRKNNYSKIILSGGPTSVPVPEADLMRIMMHAHIPDSKLLLERNSKDTIQNAVFCWELLKDRRPKSVTVVTNHTHMIKARYIFRKLYEHMGTKLRFEPVQDTYDPIEGIYFKLREHLILLKMRMFGIR